MNSPLFSVIIPTCKRPDVLAETLTRLEVQLCIFEFEVILVNDGPPEALPLLGFGEGKRVAWKLLQNPQNLGRAATRNRGIAKAMGEYLLMIDDDIWAVPELLQAHYDKQRQIGGGVVVGAVPPSPDITLNIWNAYVSERYKRIETRLRGHSIDYSFFFTGNVSVPLKLLQKHNGFDETFKNYSFEDTELGYRLFKDNAKFVHEPKAIGYHVIDESFKTLYKRAYQSGRSGHVFVSLHPELLRVIQYHSYVLGPWIGNQILKNIAKALISNRITIKALSIFVQAMAAIKFHRGILLVFPWLEFGLHIIGVRDERKSK